MCIRNCLLILLFNQIDRKVTSALIEGIIDTDTVTFMKEQHTIVVVIYTLYKIHKNLCNQEVQMWLVEVASVFFLSLLIKVKPYKIPPMSCTNEKTSRCLNIAGASVHIHRT